MKMFKYAVRKARVGAKVLKEEGALTFCIKSLQYIQKRSNRRKQTRKHIQKDSVYTRVRYEDALKVDFHDPLPRWPGTVKPNLTFNWIMPPPGKGSGGHMTLFRFIQALEKAGHTCRLYFYTQDGGGSVQAVRAIMGDSFPPLKATMAWLNDPDDMKEADGIFATSWETAYPAYASKLTAKRFYFVQDFEPYFYPVGGLSTLAENTYRFGFHGITAGKWLAKKLKQDYGMKTHPFSFGSDSSTYTYKNDAERKEILCYVRPYTERRGFELALMTLDLFHKKHPDYQISLFGWDVSNYDIPFPYNNLGILETSELNELYNRCAAGLVLSLTNMSLLPLELLSSGTIPVVNDGENNRLVSNNKYIEYAGSDPISLANKLSEVVSRKDLRTHARKASESVQNESWEASTKKIVDVIVKETKKPE